jgi:putative component of membrane protein insertase Oxa1/YidC/SpoIIIJ protein YidD
MKTLIIRVIRTYQRVNASLVALRFPLVSWSGCRQWPTCSEFTAEAIRERGALVGLWTGMNRVARCHAFTHSH